jgi:hypothetical protein
MRYVIVGRILRSSVARRPRHGTNDPAGRVVRRRSKAGITLAAAAAPEVASTD